MAEYKNGVNFRGNMSVEADDISSEVKTGRVVLVDEDLYESNEEYKAKVDKCVAEGFMRSDEAGSGGSSGGGGTEPLVINYIIANEHTDKTFGEVYEAFYSGRPVRYQWNVINNDIGDVAFVTMVSVNGTSEDGYTAHVYFTNNTLQTAPAATMDELFASHLIYGE